jgi:hypothetical protein
MGLDVLLVLSFLLLKFRGVNFFPGLNFGVLIFFFLA